MIAKETKDVELISDKKKFHLGFMETQDLASHLASEFNKRLRGLPDYSPTGTPQIKFLQCSIVVLRDPDWPAGERSVLVEKMLDTERFPWKKWNDNNGMVEGKYRHLPVDVEFELEQLEKEERGHLLAITEEEESDDDESDSKGELDGDEGKDMEAPIREISPQAYLQAFSHFSYLYTSKKVLVCDLQGVFNTEMTPPTFELTDSCIHYSSSKDRRMVFGRTDKGRSGMQSFFNSHKCTKICKFLKLSAKNKQWKRDWRRNPGWRSNK